MAATPIAAVTPTRMPAVTPRDLTTSTGLRPFLQLHMVTAMVGWAVGRDFDAPGAIYRTANGGER